MELRPLPAQSVHMQIWGTWGEARLSLFYFLFAPQFVPLSMSLTTWLPSNSPPPPSPFLNSFYLKPKWNILRWLWQCRPRLSTRNCGVWTSIGHGHGQRHGSSFSRAHIIKFAQRTSHTHTRTHTLKHCTQFVCQAKPKKEWDKIHKSEKRISTDYREYFVSGLLQQQGERATGEEDLA